MTSTLGTPDPHWQYALVIRAALQHHGRYAVEVDTRDVQARVDVQWAARQAGRLLGVRVTTEMSAPFGHADSTVTLTVRCLESGGPEREAARAGLERLRQRVEAAR